MGAHSSSWSLYALAPFKIAPLASVGSTSTPHETPEHRNNLAVVCAESSAAQPPAPQQHSLYGTHYVMSRELRTRVSARGPSFA